MLDAAPTERANQMLQVRGYDVKFCLADDPQGEDLMENLRTIIDAPARNSSKPHPDLVRFVLVGDTLIVRGTYQQQCHVMDLLGLPKGMTQN
jgi:hypothetical protein